MREYNKELSPRTERAITLAMNVHPDKRLQSVKEFKEALMGEWNPQQYPNAAMPAPGWGDLIKATEEQVLIWVSVLMLLISVVVTLVK